MEGAPWFLSGHKSLDKRERERERERETTTGCLRVCRRKCVSVSERGERDTHTDRARDTMRCERVHVHACVYVYVCVYVCGVCSCCCLLYTYVHISCTYINAYSRVDVQEGLPMESK